jgi:hypothetical protein
MPNDINAIMPTVIARRGKPMARFTKKTAPRTKLANAKGAGAGASGKTSPHSRAAAAAKNSIVKTTKARGGRY